MRIGSSIGKRAKALLLLAVAIPFAASAEEDLPVCTISESVSPDAVGTTKFYHKLDDTSETKRLYVDFSISLMPRTIRVIDPDTRLADPEGPLLTFNYYNKVDTAFGSLLFPRTAYTSTPFQNLTDSSVDGWVMTLTLDDRFGGEVAETTYSKPFRSVDNGEIDTSSLSLMYDHLNNDIELVFRSLDRKQYRAIFTYSRTGAAAAYDLARPQYESLAKIYEAGECRPETLGDCFLTTAACEVVGLDDDCWELRTLRRFRDGWLANQKGGASDIAAYYEKAPAIAERLRQDRRAALKLYWTRIVPSALAASIGANRLARAIYSRGMRDLAAA